MKAYKCDRCGKLYEKYKNQGTSQFFNITCNPCTIGNLLDLCPECNAELQEWVANPTEQVACNYPDEEEQEKQTEEKTDKSCESCRFVDLKENEFPCSCCSKAYGLRWQLKDKEGDS